MSFAFAQYSTARIETASPLRLVIELYDGSLSRLRDAREAIEAGDRSRSQALLCRAHAIVSELQSTLDPQHAPEICAQLESLYDFVLHRITKAHLRSELESIDDAVRVLRPLRDTWAEVASTQR